MKQGGGVVTAGFCSTDAIRYEISVVSAFSLFYFISIYRRHTPRLISEHGHVDRRRSRLASLFLTASCGAEGNDEIKPCKIKKHG